MISSLGILIRPNLDNWWIDYWNDPSSITVDSGAFPAYYPCQRKASKCRLADIGPLFEGNKTRDRSKTYTVRIIEEGLWIVGFFFLMAVLVVIFSALFRVEKLKVWKDHLDWFNWLQLVVERKIIPNEAFFLAWKPRLFISTCTVGNMVLKAAALFYSAF